jgi:hypothetical protein
MALRWRRFTRHRDHDGAIFASIRSVDRPQCTGSCILAVGRAPSFCNDRYCTIPRTNTPRREVFQPPGLLRRLSEILGSFPWSFCRELKARSIRETFSVACNCEQGRPTTVKCRPLRNARQRDADPELSQPEANDEHALAPAQALRLSRRHPPAETLPVRAHAHDAAR